MMSTSSSMTSTSGRGGDQSQRVRQMGQVRINGPRSVGTRRSRRQFGHDKMVVSDSIGPFTTQKPSTPHPGLDHINSKNDSRPMWVQNFSTRSGNFPSLPDIQRSIQRSIEPRKHHLWTRNVLASSSTRVNRMTFM